MIKLHGFICALACVFFFSGCGDDSEYSYSYQDMISFLLDEPVMEGYVESVTRLDAAPDSRVALLVSRNISLMERYPKQTVQVVVDDALSTAVEGTDFDFTPRSLEFGKSTFQLPFSVNIHGAKGKTIVLQLVYGYYDECPLETRVADRLTITVK